MSDYFNGDWFSGPTDNGSGAASNMTGGDWFGGLFDTSTPASTYDPYSLANWGATDNANAPANSTPWYSGITNALGSAVNGISGGDVLKYGGLLGSILAATQSKGSTTKATSGPGTTTSTPVYSSAAQSGISELLNSALPYSQSNLLNSGMSSDASTLYNYLMGGGGNNLNQLLNLGTETRNTLNSGLQDLDINNLIKMVGPQITSQVMKSYGPYAATKGGAQLATTQELTKKAADFAQQRAAYRQTAANTLNQSGIAQSGILSQLLGLAQTPTTASNTAYNSYLDTIRTLLGLQSGSTGTTSGGTTTTTAGTDIWSKLAPLFSAMTTTGTPAQGRTITLNLGQ